MTLHRVPLYITEDQLDYFFAKFDELADILCIKSKPASQLVMVKLIRKNFMEIPNVLICGGCSIYVVVEGRHPLCWYYSTAGQLSKSYPRKNPAPAPASKPAAPEKAVGTEKSSQTPSSSNEWPNVVRRWKKSAAPLPQQDVPIKKAVSPME